MSYAEYLAAESTSEVRLILEAGPGESIELASLGIRLDLAAVCANPLAAG